MNDTALSWFFDRIRHHFKDDDVFSDVVTAYAIAKQKEREQHGNTWDAAIKAHEDRGSNISRSLCDFDDLHEIQ
jgi:hypothetical protein